MSARTLFVVVATLVAGLDDRSTAMRLALAAAAMPIGWPILPPAVSSGEDLLDLALVA